MDKDKDDKGATEPEGPWKKSEAEPETVPTDEADKAVPVADNSPTQEYPPVAVAESDEGPERAEALAGEPADNAQGDVAGATSDTPETSAAADQNDPGFSSEPTSAISVEEKRGGGMGGWIVLIVLAVVIGGSGFFAWPYLLNRATDWLPATLVAAIQANGETLERLEQVEADVDGLKSQAGETQAQLRALRAELANMPAGNDGGSDPRVGELAQSLAALSDAVNDLQNRNEALAQKVDSLTSAAAGATAGGMAEAAQALQSGVAERLSAADARAEAAEARALAAEELARAADSKLQSLEQRLAALESTPSRTPVDEQRAAVLALGQLRAAVDAGRPYDAALETVESVFGGDQELAPLRIHARTGIATLSALKARFPTTIEAAIHARTSDGSLWDRTVERLTGLVTVRRIGEVEGDETDAVMARAEVRLNNNDLAGAVNEVKTLEGPAAEAVRSWLRDAIARVEAEQALDALQDAAIAKTAAG